MKKYCACCDAIHDTSEFRLNASKKDGFQTYCKSCGDFYGQNHCYPHAPKKRGRRQAYMDAALDPDQPDHL